MGVRDVKCVRFIFNSAIITGAAHCALCNDALYPIESQIKELYTHKHSHTHKADVRLRARNAAAQLLASTLCEYIPFIANDEQRARIEQQ